MRGNITQNNPSRHNYREAYTLVSQQITWDLSGLFLGVTDPKLNQSITEAAVWADSFEGKYRGKMAGLSAEGLLECIKEVETFEVKFSDVSLFASLAFAADMTQTETQALNDRVSKFDAKLAKQLAFYSLELGELVRTNPQLIENPALINYRHMLERVLQRVEHQLSEAEEQLIIEKDQFGVNAWEELQSKWLNTRLFEVSILGEKKTLSYGEANGLFAHLDRATRKSANQAIYGLLGSDGEIFSAALRSICNDWVAISKRRKYSSPMESSLISNNTQQNIIDNLLRTIEEGSAVYRRYLKLKAKFMGLSVLANYDITAPLPNMPEQRFSYTEAQNIITEAYSRFDPNYAEAVKEMFQNCRIDASPRFGKRNGAFCASDYNAKSAYILQSFNGTLSDVFTLAHELGHATHDWYMARNQTRLNTNVPSTVAETASIFGELLLTDLMLKNAKTEAEQKALLCMVLDEAGMTAFQVTARVWFEQSLYQSIEKDDYLDYPTICRHWTQARNRIFGEAVEWLPEMDAEWTMKPHYYMANYRFYNYPYVYAQMFVYSLYERYLEENTKFVPKLVGLLSAGSSKSTQELGRIVGLDLTAPDFWKGGLKVFERFVTDLEKIV